MPSSAKSNPDARQQYINGHFCYAAKIGILTNGLGIPRHISLFDDDFKQRHKNFILYSSLLGALTAAGLEGAGVVTGEIGTYTAGRDIMKVDGGAERLASVGKTFSADTAAYKIASRIDENTDAYTIGRLLTEVDATLSEQNISDISRGLVERGHMTVSDADKLARQYAVMLDNSMSLTEEQAEILKAAKKEERASEKAAKRNAKRYGEVIERLSEFVQSIKDYFNSLSANPSREANALKEQIGDTVRYVERIVKSFDDAAVGAVEAYQATVAKDEVRKAEKKTETKAETEVAEGTEAAEETEVTEDTPPETLPSYVRKVSEISETPQFQERDGAEENVSDITADDVRALREIGRKSINDFTGDDIKKAEPFARKLFSEIGVKSPFFRSWFGDWRAYDNTGISPIENTGETRGTFRNKDTGWDIIVSKKIHKETNHQSGKSVKNAVQYLPYIEEITKNAVLFDSVVSDKENGLSVMFHSLYAYTDVMGYPTVLKLTVEELTDEKSGSPIRRDYILQDITEKPLLVRDRLSTPNRNGNGSSETADGRSVDSSTTAPRSDTVPVNSIADLHALVKSFDKNFSPKPVNSSLLNEDGTPRVFYHGTRAENGNFTVFDYEKAVKRGGLGLKALGKGNYFTSRVLNGSERYGSRVIPAYLNIQNPFIYNGGKSISEQFSEETGIQTENNDALQAAMRDAGYDGVLQTTGKDIIAVAFDSEQIKSASDNIGTFNGDDPDIRYQERTDVLSDREVLERVRSVAAVYENLTDAERGALDIFEKRLSDLSDLKSQRKELRKLYKEQTSDENANREKATETQNRLSVLDAKIDRANADILSAEDKTVLKKVLKKARGIVEADQSKFSREALTRYRERRDNAAAVKKYRDRVRTEVEGLMKTILHPNNKDIAKHVPDVLKEPLLPLLKSIDMSSKQSLRGGEATNADRAFIDNMRRVESALMGINDPEKKYAGYIDLPEHFMGDLNKYIKTVTDIANANGGEFVINRMTADELKTLYGILKNLKRAIEGANRFHYNAMFKHVSDAGDNSVAYMKELGKARRTGAVSNFTLWQNMRPAFAFERFGEGGIAIYDGLRRGQAQLARNTKEILDFSNEAYTAKEVKAWEKEIKTFKLGEDEVRIPVSYLMSFYRLTKDEGAMGHINGWEGGEGIRVATYKHNGKKIEDRGHVLTQEDISMLISALTDRQKQVADKLQGFMETRGSAWGNHVTLARFGEEQYKTKNYFPINTDGRHLPAKLEEKPEGASFYALLNMGFTKERDPNAKNRIMVYSIFDVFANHMASMAQYNALALPVLDAVKWFNYAQMKEDGMGGYTAVDGGSIRERMDIAFGVDPEQIPGKGKPGYAQKFVMNVIKAFNGTEAQGSQYDTFGTKLLHRYNRAQVAANLSSAIKQPTAIARAGLLMNLPILKGATINPKTTLRDIAEMQKYSGIALWKSMGFYDVNVSIGLTDLIKHKKTLIDKIEDGGMHVAEKADELTWGAIWRACKREVSRKQKMKPTDDGYFDAVTELFEDIIYKTQVVDSVLTKTEFTRDKGFLARSAGSFMSEPVASASMLLDVYDKMMLDVQRGMPVKTALKKHGAKFGRTLTVYAASAALTAAAGAVVAAMRNDDDYATYTEKYQEEFLSGLAEELNPISKYPIASDIYDIVSAAVNKLRGVDDYTSVPQSAWLQWADSLLSGSDILSDIIHGKQTNYTVWGGVYKMLQAASGIAGIPAAPFARDAIAIWNTTVGVSRPDLKLKTYESSELSQIKYAYIDGYLTREEAIAEIKKKELKKEEEIEFTLDEWDYVKENGSSDGYSKYDKFIDAVETGTNLKSVINDYLSKGAKASTMASRITDNFKPIYKAMTNAERARLKGYLLNAYELLGYKRSEKSKDIDAWLTQKTKK